MDETSDGVGYRRIAALVMFAAVGLGAIGSHALEGRLEAAERVGTWDTAVLYHLIHGVALLVIAGLGAHLRKPWWCLLIGTVLFSGSLYVLCLTGMKWLVAITPFGGVSLTLGWLWLAIRK